MSGNGGVSDRDAVDGENGNALGNINGNRPDSLTHSDHLKVCVGVPVYFFFKLNSDKLVDESQLVNLDDIAKIAKEENLKIKISGAADLEAYHGLYGCLSEPCRHAGRTVSFTGRNETMQLTICDLLQKGRKHL